MKNGWTGGQYSLFRVIFGAYLFGHFVQLIPWSAEVFSNRGVLPQASASPLFYLMPNVLALVDSPLAVCVLLVLGVGLSGLFLVGWHDRIAAALLWYVWACLFSRNPLIANPSLPFIGWLLLAHCCLPPAPYGSWAARGRAEPGGDWQMPPPIYGAAWVVMALAYTYSGYTKLISPSWIDGTALARVLDNPLARPTFIRQALLGLPDWLLCLATWSGLLLELAFAPLALVARLRPWLWTLMLGLHLTLIVLIDFADLSLGMVMVHLFTFDPAWVKVRPITATELLFYDGHCGLCHRAVRFVLAEDVGGKAFRFAPLKGEAFRAAVSADEQAKLPDSLVLRTSEGKLLTRARGVLHLMERLGGCWRILASIARLVPAKLLDKLYDGVARIRYRLFQQPSEACPLVGPELRKRFDV